MRSLSNRELVELFSEHIRDIDPELFRLILLQGRSRRAGPDPFAAAVDAVEAFNARAASKTTVFAAECAKPRPDSSEFSKT